MARWSAYLRRVLEQLRCGKPKKSNNCCLYRVGHCAVGTDEIFGIFRSDLPWVMLSLARRHKNDAAPRPIRAKVTRIVKEKMQGLAAGAIIAEAVVAEPKAETETTTSKAKAETETTTAKAKAETEVIIAKAKVESEVVIAKAKVESEVVIAKAKVETELIITKAKAETETIITKAKAETETIITKAKAETESAFTDVASKRLFGILKAAMGTRVQWMVSPMKKGTWLRNNARTKM
ncbi:hypothetical protein M438DRAFT_360319 [Aureobasidium pullulans EXF-150]|uniref:Uncharacterized protein n=1 Tax=Aureobasidium pullulans EXF-150 TaxID=1043002 RepID=A0A074X4H3_AURPU|nr:uncharacterized protein M438DRAFT_360319 [Aureobasidium pullulans EXF-150]KEQ78634.1 hypothetical protein M438DRAFT_360319 [Aureobasidium pullulans EXF-150]